MDNIYEELGVRPVLNAQGNRTLLGGGTPSEAVRELMDSVEDYYVNMGELMDSVGVRISDMLGVESALVTSGCAAALAYAAAACMTGDDSDRIEQIPDTTGMPNEIIIQRQLRIKYDRSMSIPGGKLIEIGDEDGTTAEHLEEAIGPNTAAIHYLAPGDRTPGALPIEQVIEIGHSRDIPIIVDAAGEVYPTEKLSSYVKSGADLVAYGAKYFGAVNSSGILTGRKDLVSIARSHSFIGFEDSSLRSFGRPMKVDRQEVVAVYAALREWITMNHEDRFASYEVRIDAMRNDLPQFEGVTFSDYPQDAPAEALMLTIDPAKAGKSAQDVIDELKAGNPSIWVRELPEDNSLAIRMLTLREGGEKVIAQRLREILG
jgi:L-seryl-tRNA(Ser) seleniumtransferase